MAEKNQLRIERIGNRNICIAGVGKMFFARPAKDTKVFSGQVFMRHAWDEWVEHCLGNETAPIIQAETKVVLSSLKETNQEIRCWVVAGKVITMSIYRFGRRVKYENCDDWKEAKQFAHYMANVYQPARAFVIDIALYNGEFKVIEINCINCSGFYDMNFQKLLLALEEEFN